MNLKRAFETIDRERLLEKMYQYGIRRRILKNSSNHIWIIENSRCDLIIHGLLLLTTEYGVPQGSILGPLLFIIYINDIIEVCPEGYNIKMFTDETLIYVSGESSANLEVKLITVFNIIEHWMNINKLKMNARKTK